MLYNVIFLYCFGWDLSRKCVFRAKLAALNRVFLQKLPHVSSPHFSHGGILDK